MGRPFSLWASCQTHVDGFGFLRKTQRVCVISNFSNYAAVPLPCLPFYISVCFLYFNCFLCRFSSEAKFVSGIVGLGLSFSAVDSVSLVGVVLINYLATSIRYWFARYCSLTISYIYVHSLYIMVLVRLVLGSYGSISLKILYNSLLVKKALFSLCPFNFNSVSACICKSYRCCVRLCVSGKYTFFITAKCEIRSVKRA